MPYHWDQPVMKQACWWEQERRNLQSNSLLHLESTIKGNYSAVLSSNAPRQAASQAAICSFWSWRENRTKSHTVSAPKMQEGVYMQMFWWVHLCVSALGSRVNTWNRASIQTSGFRSIWLWMYYHLGVVYALK